ncbi:MAG: hypothetical protein ACFE95_17780 [Candidatus Hodarchaeota archaeon]
MNQKRLKSIRLRLTYHESINFLNNLRIIQNGFNFDKVKKEFQYFRKDSLINCKLKLPVLIHILNPDIFALSHLNDLPTEIPNYLLLLIRAGYAALSICQHGEFKYHKTIRKYMVRKKRGKAQYTYQVLKGKARGGAKLRLEKTNEFFLEINQKLLDWHNSIKKIDLIMLQCSPRIWRGLFMTKLKPPFSNKDKRIRKIPLVTYKPTFKELKRINYVLLNGTIAVQSDRAFNNTSEVIQFLNSL